MKLMAALKMSPTTENAEASWRWYWKSRRPRQKVVGPLSKERGWFEGMRTVNMVPSPLRTTADTSNRLKATRMKTTRSVLANVRAQWPSSRPSGFVASGFRNMNGVSQQGTDGLR